MRPEMRPEMLSEMLVEMLSEMLSVRIGVEEAKGLWPRYAEEEHHAYKTQGGDQKRSSGGSHCRAAVVTRSSRDAALQA